MEGRRRVLKILKTCGIPEIVADAIQDSYSEARAKVTQMVKLMNLKSLLLGTTSLLLEISN